MNYRYRGGVQLNAPTVKGGEPRWTALDGWALVLSLLALVAMKLMGG
jgi:hypothetical protein